MQCKLINELIHYVSDDYQLHLWFGSTQSSVANLR